MKHTINLTLTLTTICLPLTAKASCDRFPDSTLTLNLPATISVPDNLALGSVILTQAFDGASPAFIANCSHTANVTFRFTGTPASGNTTLFANTGSAGGIGLWLYSRINGVTQTISPNDTRTVAAQPSTSPTTKPPRSHR